MDKQTYDFVKKNNKKIEKVENIISCNELKLGIKFAVELGGEPKINMDYNNSYRWYRFIIKAIEFNKIDFLKYAEPVIKFEYLKTYRIYAQKVANNNVISYLNTLTSSNSTS